MASGLHIAVAALNGLADHRRGDLVRNLDIPHLAFALRHEIECDAEVCLNGRCFRVDGCEGIPTRRIELTQARVSKSDIEPESRVSILLGDRKELLNSRTVKSVFG